MNYTSYNTYATDYGILKCIRMKYQPPLTTIFLHPPHNLFVCPGSLHNLMGIRNQFSVLWSTWMISQITVLIIKQFWFQVLYSRHFNEWTIGRFHIIAQQQKWNNVLLNPVKLTITSSIEKITQSSMKYGI